MISTHLSPFLSLNEREREKGRERPIGQSSKANRNRHILEKREKEERKEEER